MSAAEMIVHGDTDAAIGGGTESMSRAPYWLNAVRWGARMNDTTAVDVLVAALTDPFDEIHMGLTAENVARKWGITREDQDAVGSGKPSPSDLRDRDGKIQEPDRSSGTQEPQRQHFFRYRRIATHRCDHGEPRQAQTGIR